MSRSNPTENSPNPATRRYEWNGEAGTVRYYDRDAKKNVDIGTDFTFILLDEMASVGGWDDKSGTKGSAIYSNEVRDTRTDVLVVKSFKGGILAEGLYKDIKDRVATQGGQFVAVCYIAFKTDTGELAIGTLKFKGAALAAWMEFRKAHRADLYKSAIRVHDFVEGKKGRVVFRVPVMKLMPVTADTDKVAIALDKELQAYMTAYLKRTKRDQVEQAEEVERHREPGDDDGLDEGYDEPARNVEVERPAPVAAPVAASSSAYHRNPEITLADIPF